MTFTKLNQNIINISENPSRSNNQPNTLRYGVNSYTVKIQHHDERI